MKRLRYPGSMDAAGLPALLRAIRDLHGVEGQHVESVDVRETFNGQTVWEGSVQVFDLVAHPSAKRAYAWSYPTEGSKRRYIVVLHEGPINSPVKAVRAVIANDYRTSQKR